MRDKTARPGRGAAPLRSGSTEPGDRAPRQGCTGGDREGRPPAAPRNGGGGEERAGDEPSAAASPPSRGSATEAEGCPAAPAAAAEQLAWRCLSPRLSPARRGEAAQHGGGLAARHSARGAARLAPPSRPGGRRRGRRPRGGVGGVRGAWARRMWRGNRGWRARGVTVLVPLPCYGVRNTSREGRCGKTEEGGEKGGSGNEGEEMDDRWCFVGHPPGSPALDHRSWTANHTSGACASAAETAVIALALIHSSPGSKEIQLLPANRCPSLG